MFILIQDDVWKEHVGNTTCMEVKDLGNIFIQKSNMEDGVKILLQRLLSLSCNFKIVEPILS